MVRPRILSVVVVLIVLALLAAACGGGGNSRATPADTSVPAAEESADSEADAEAMVEESATEAPEAGATAAAADEAVATAAAGAEAVGEEVASQAEAELNPLIQVVSETSIADVINENNPYLVTLSNGGAHVTWPKTEGRFWNRERELCIYTFNTAATECDVAADNYEGYPYAFFWSPDDKYIAWTENPIQLGYESDIWVFDTTTKEFENLTDDGVTGDWVAAEPGSYMLDYLPMWNQQDGDIYFWRSIPDPSFALSMTLSIMSVSPASGVVELVREVQGPAGGDLIWFNGEMWYMDGVSALSPDGSRVAVLAVSVDEDTGADENDGLWIVNVDDATMPPVQLVSSDGFQAANPSWSNAPLVPSGLSWAANGERLVVIAQNQDPQEALVVLYDVDAASGAVSPVVDFSDVPDISAYTAEPADGGVPPRFYSPWTASMSPDNEQLLMYQNIANVAGILVSPLPPTGTLPGMDHESTTEDPVPTVRSSRSRDGKVLIYNILFNLAPQ